MLSAVTTYMPKWLMAIIATALVLATVVGSNQGSAQAIEPGETDIAYVADGYNFPDALMGATLAGLNTAPMLGVRGPASGDVVPPETAAELDRLTNDKANKLDTIYVFGGSAAVSDKVVGELGAWATNVERIFGADRFGTMKAISEALPSKVKDSDLLDGMDSSDFLGATDKAADSELLDGKDSTEFLGAGEKAADADAVDGIDSPQLQLPDVLPSGRTLQGVYGVEDGGADGSGGWSNTVTFQLPLPADLDDTQVHFIGTGDPPPAECPGTVEDPQADPGHLCVYEDASSGHSIVRICNPTALPDCSAADRLGFFVSLSDDGTAGGIWSVGSWAVTAP